MCSINDSGGGGGGNVGVVTTTCDIEAAAVVDENIREHVAKAREDDAASPSSSSFSSGCLISILRRLPVNEICGEVIPLTKIACPVALTTLLLFSKNIISMLFLGHMGKTELAGGSLAIGFANVTGHSVMKGLCMGMDPICCQAYGAKRFPLVSQTYIKMFLLLLSVSIPIILLWLNVEPVFIRIGQDRVISKVAKGYLVFCIPELLANAHLNPLRSFLRTQGLNSPATLVATCATILHLPITYFLVTYLNLKVKGIALSSVLYALNVNTGLLIYLVVSKVSIKPWVGASLASVAQGWKPLLSLAVPSLFAVCLEWWWYEIILFLSGLLDNPDSCVAAMGILIQTTGTIYVFPFSLSLSISQRVGHGLGAGQPEQARSAATAGFCIALGVGLLAFGLSVALRSVLGRLYTDDPQILALIEVALPLLGLAEVGNSPQTAACGALTGSARPNLGVRINMASFYLVGLPCATVFAFKLKIGFRGLWLGLVAAQAACLTLMIWTLFQTDWKLQAKRAEELTQTAAADKEDAGANLVTS